MVIQTAYRKNWWSNDLEQKISAEYILSMYNPNPDYWNSFTRNKERNYNVSVTPSDGTIDGSSITNTIEINRTTSSTPVLLASDVQIIKQLQI